MISIIRRLLILSLTISITSCSDTVDNVSEKTADTINPTVLNTKPNADSPFASVISPIRIVFSEKMSITSIAKENFRLLHVPPAGTPQSVELASDGFSFLPQSNSVFMKPAIPLNFSSRYKVEIDADITNNIGVQDESGNVLQPNSGDTYSWTFTTKENLPAALFAISPKDGASGVERKPTIQVFFDEDFLSASAVIDESILSVTLATGAVVDGVFSYDNVAHTVTFIPNNFLPMDEVVSIELKVNDQNQVDLLSYMSSFTVKNGNLSVNNAVKIQSDTSIYIGSEVPIDRGRYGYQNIDSVADDKGNVTVLWRQKFSTLFANRYQIGTGWSKDAAGGYSAVAISGGVEGRIRQVRQIVDRFGNVTVVWQKAEPIIGSTSSMLSLWSIRYDINSGWQKNDAGEISPVRIETEDSAPATDPVLVVDNAGNVTVIFKQALNGDENLWANRYDLSTGQWNGKAGDSTAIMIDREVGPIISLLPITAVDALGNIAVAWIQKVNTTTEIWATRYSVNDGWRTELMQTRALRISNPSEGSIGFITSVVDDFGVSTLVWHQASNIATNNYSSIWVSRRAISTGWLPNNSVKIENDIEDSFYPTIAADSKGNVVVVWGQADGLWSNRYDVNSGWEGVISDGNIQAVKIDPVRPSTIQPIMIDPQDNVHLVWNKAFQLFDLKSTQFDLQNGWQKDANGILSGTLIENDDRGSISNVKTTMDSIGNILAVWRHRDDLPFTYDLSYNYYTQSNKSWINDGNGLGIGTLIEQNIGDVKHFDLASDSEGNAMVIWLQPTGAVDNLLASRFDASTRSWWKNSSGLFEGKLVESNDVSITYHSTTNDPLIQSDGLGNFTIIWLESRNIWANRFE